MKSLLRIAVVAGLLLGSSAAFAAEVTPVGTWKTIDDETGKPKSIVKITDEGGELKATVIQVLQSEDGPHPICKACDGERKDKPVEGMNVFFLLDRSDSVPSAQQLAARQLVNRLAAEKEKNDQVGVLVLTSSMGVGARSGPRSRPGPPT